MALQDRNGNTSQLPANMEDLSLQDNNPPKPLIVPSQLHPIYTGDEESRIRDAPSSPVRIRQLSRELASSEVGIIEDGARPGMTVRADSSIRHVPPEPQAPPHDPDTPPPHHLASPQTHIPTASEPTVQQTPPPQQQQQKQQQQQPLQNDAASGGFNFEFDSTPDIHIQKARTRTSPPLTPAPHLSHQPRKPSESILRKPVGQTLPHANVASSESSETQSRSSFGRDSPHSQSDLRIPRAPIPRPGSVYQLGTDIHNRGRSITPQQLRQASLSPHPHARAVSHSSNGSAADRPMSYVDLMNVPYAQQMAQQTLTTSNALLRGAVGNNASLLDTRKTLEMYRANVKKTNDMSVQYEFALFMLNVAREAALEESRSRASESVKSSKKGEELESVSLTKEAKSILQRLSDRGYGYAQYYLGDGYASGVFNHGKPDNDRAFPLFVAAGKHGHMEANYRAALCYEFGWGCRKDIAKAVQFFRQAASKGHPGAATRLGKACLSGDMGLGVKYRDGIRWLKRGTEAADIYHNSAPYELGMMHVNGYGDDIFKDEAYAAQLLTQAAELGHPLAAFKMGEAYEHGLLTCPRDAALSLHFYNGAADKGMPEAMMALCAWYMVGADPVLPKDEAEAYEWAKRAAATGMAKAEYAVAYFTEMGIGCRRDPLEANVYYVRAADQGDERAKQRLAIIRAAESGDPQPSGPATSVAVKPKHMIKKKKNNPSTPAQDGQSATSPSEGKADEKDCCVM